MKDKNIILTTVSMYHALNDGATSVILLLFPIFKEIYNLNYTQIGLPKWIVPSEVMESAPIKIKST